MNATGNNPEIAKEDLIDKKTRMRALIASAVGSSVEWFDFFLYGTMAALVFNKLFFPSDDAYVSMMLSYVSFAFEQILLVRPIGGIDYFFISYNRNVCAWWS